MGDDVKAPVRRYADDGRDFSRRRRNGGLGTPNHLPRNKRGQHLTEGDNMPCHLLEYGSYVTRGEERAALFLHEKLSAESDHWHILTNIELPVGGRMREIDLIIVGPGRVFVVDVKSFAGPVAAEGKTWLLSDGSTRNDPVGNVEQLAQQVAGQLRNRSNNALRVRVEGRLFFTEDDVRLPDDPSAEAYCFRRSQYREMLQLASTAGAGSPPADILRWLEPGAWLRARQGVKRVGEYRLVEQIKGFELPNRTSWLAKTDQSRKAVIRLYDLSGVPASERESQRRLCKAEYEALATQLRSNNVVKPITGFQAVDGYGGELYYFAVEHPQSATLAERIRSLKEGQPWPFETRVRLAAELSHVLADIHGQPIGETDRFIVHRRLRPESIYLHETETNPLLTGFDVARAMEQTIHPGHLPWEPTPYDAPEIRSSLTRATKLSDIYSLGVIVYEMLSAELPFSGVHERGMEMRPLKICGGDVPDRSNAENLEVLLEEMLAFDAGERAADAETLAQLLREVANGLRVQEDRAAEVGPPRQEPLHPVPEGAKLDERHQVLRVLAETPTAWSYHVNDLVSGRDYVAKVWRPTDPKTRSLLFREFGWIALAGSDCPNLVKVTSVNGDEAAPFNLLLEYVGGESLGRASEQLPARAQLEGVEPWQLAMRWGEDVLRALQRLHAEKILHRDVSPSNIIIADRGAVLIDLGVAASPERMTAAEDVGTWEFRAPEIDHGGAWTEQCDLYSLAAVLFHTITGRLHFDREQGDKSRLRTELIKEAAPAQLVRALLETLSVDPAKRPRTASEMQERLVAAARGELAGITTEIMEPLPTTAPVSAPIRRLERAPYLESLMQLYQRSVLGNAETRGLDSEFSRNTYIRTRLDETVADLVRANQVSLVALAGNPGDGKTALLQQLASDLGVTRSELEGQREWSASLSDGTRVFCNLDASAAWQGQSSDEVLDRFLEPLLDGPTPSQVRLLAVNDGRLLEWLEDRHEGESRWLFDALRYHLGLLDALPNGAEQAIAYMDLNYRSLVGDAGTTESSCVERMVASLVEGTPDGKPADADPWEPCHTCRAAEWCHVWFSVRTLRDPDLGPLVKSRILALFQATHLRGQVHITMRQLRGALSYMLFGNRTCDQIANMGNEEGDGPPAARSLLYYSNLFATEEQPAGELLPALKQLDPGRGDHPAVDRELFAVLRGSPPTSVFVEAPSRRGPAPVLPGPYANDIDALQQLRRRLYFEGSPEVFGKCGMDPSEMLGYPAFPEMLELCAQDVGHGAALTRICRGLSLAERVPPEYVEEHPGMALGSGRNASTSTVIFRHYPRDRFQIERPLPPSGRPAHEWLPDHLVIVHQGAKGGDIRLRIGLDLYQYLWDLAEGYAPGVPEFEAVFANLDVFRDRLLLLPASELVASHPIHGNFRIVASDDGTPVLELRRL